MDPLLSGLDINFLSIENNSFSANIVKIIAIAFCIILSAFFAAAETAISSANPYKIEALADDGKKTAKLSLRILNKVDKTIIDLLIYINLLHIASSTLMTVLMVSLIPENPTLGAVLSTVIITILVFFFSEMLPKTISNLNPEKSLLNLSFFVYATGIVCYPISLIFRGLVKLLKLIFKVNNKENEINEDDFVDTVEDIEDQGLLEEEESDLIQAAVEFGDYTVKQVMTKKEDMICYNAAKSSKKDVLKFVLNVNYTRVPVYEGDLNNIIGVLHIKKFLLNCLDKNKQIRFKSMLSKPLFVKESTLIDDMLDIFQEKRTHIAFVQGKDGTVMGMVTMEDVIEKLVGDIDEVNPPKADLGGEE